MCQKASAFLAGRLAKGALVEIYAINCIFCLGSSESHTRIITLYYCIVLLLLLLAHGNFSDIYSWMTTLMFQVLYKHQPPVDRVIIKCIPTDQKI